MPLYMLNSLAKVEKVYFPNRSDNSNGFSQIDTCKYLTTVALRGKVRI